MTYHQLTVEFQERPIDDLVFTASIVGITIDIRIYWWLVDLHDGWHDRIAVCDALGGHILWH